MSEMSRPFTKLELRFIEEYVIDLNASRAVIAAGYKNKTKGSIYNQACNLMKKVHIKEEIDKRLADRRAKSEITAEMIIAELAKIAFSNMKNVFDPKTGKMKNIAQISDADFTAISSIDADETQINKKVLLKTKKIKMYDKIKALEKLGQHLGMFQDKSQDSSAELVEALKKLAQGLPN